MNYEVFLNLLYYSKLIISDSGGIQEECCILKKKMLTIRSSTERQETLKVGGNLLINLNNYSLKKIKKHIKINLKWKNPYGNFNVSSKITKEIRKILKILMISVIVPVFNEEGNILNVINKIRQSISTNDEIEVVNAVQITQYQR